MLNRIKKLMGLETRSSGSGYTAEIISARESYISGRTGIGDLTATVQSCISLWENGLGLADIQGQSTILDRRSLALAARSLALRGEAIFYINRDTLVPAYDWDLASKNGRPYAYRLSVADTGGGRQITALAQEVLHFAIGVDVAAPYYGSAPLRRASLTAGLLQAVESSLSEVYSNAPIGSLVIPFPESDPTNLARLGDQFGGKRGRVLLRESVQVSAVGGAMPASDWRPADLPPDLKNAMTTENMEAARAAISNVFGVLPALTSSSTTGPLVREAQRHLAQWTLQPMAVMMAEEVSAKLETPIEIDVMRPLQAFDAGGRARALKTTIDALALAKDAGVDASSAASLVDWS